MSDKSSFFSELKRRNVYKVAAAYAVVGWLLIQIATQVFPFFEIPNWAVRLVVLAIVIGFPIALVIAWAFELTPEGLKRTPDADPVVAAQRPRQRAWIFVVIVAGALSLGLFFLGRYTAGSKSASSGDPSNKSIAVLPFVNMSADKENEFFADGVSEEILNSLARIDSMRVIARTSSFQFKGKTDDLRAIGEKLGAANVLEGSVRREGQRARITAQLVRTSDGIHLWSETYDRTLTDTLAVQVDIAAQVAAVLNVVLDEKQRANMHTAGVKNVDAFIAYQKGMKLFADAHDATKTNSVIDGLRLANKEFDRAISLEPAFSQAYFQAADLYIHVLLADDPSESEKLEARRAALSYFQLSAANSHDEQERLLTLVERQLLSDDWHGLAANIDAALRHPGCSAPDWVPVFAGAFGYGDLVEDLGARISVCDPLNAIKFSNRARAALCSGRAQRVLDVLSASERARGGAPVPNVYRVQALIMLGRIDEAKAQAAAMSPENEGYYKAQVFVGTATGESPASIHARLQSLDRSHSIYKMFSLTDAVEVVLSGDRAEANRRAAAYDARPAGPFILAVLTSDCLHGAPFDLDATPNFKARLAESGLPWPPISPMKYPDRLPEPKP